MSGEFNASERDASVGVRPLSGGNASRSFRGFLASAPVLPPKPPEWSAEKWSDFATGGLVPPTTSTLLVRLVTLLKLLTVFELSLQNTTFATASDLFGFFFTMNSASGLVEGTGRTGLPRLPTVVKPSSSSMTPKKSISSAAASPMFPSAFGAPFRQSLPRCPGRPHFQHGLFSRGTSAFLQSLVK